MEYTYRAKNKEGKTIKGVVEAEGKERAVSLLKDRGYFIISLKEGGGVGLDLEKINPFKKVSRDEVVIFTRQLSTMINAGLSLNDALFSLKEQVSPKFAEIIDEVLRRVESGKSLGESLSGWPDIFSDIYVASVKSGEAAGVLDKVLSRLADDQEEEKSFRNNIKGALIYPIIVVVMMVIVGAIVMIFVVPQMLSLYSELDADLPAPTKILMAISDFVVKAWWLVLAIIGGLIYLFIKFKNTEKGARKIDEIILRLPIIGALQEKTILANMSRTLGLLLGTGLSLVEALDIIANSVGNLVFRDAIKQCARGVEKGRSLSGMMANFSIFPPILYQMVAVGEGTGKIDESLEKVSTFFKGEAETAVKGLTTALGPIIMIVLGVGVMFLVVAVLMPIYNLTSTF
ncbi:MAG: type II secretion system F domain protein [Microgenomates bacterium 39_7]|nr:MAG: type II secretion system F domain protein [Microgenomates bacterium 39_7]